MIKADQVVAKEDRAGELLCGHCSAVQSGWRLTPAVTEQVRHRAEMVATIASDGVAGAHACGMYKAKPIGKRALECKERAHANE